MAEARRRREQRYAAAMQSRVGMGMVQQHYVREQPVYRGPPPLSSEGGTTEESSSSPSSLGPLVVFPSLLLSSFNNNSNNNNINPSMSFDETSSMGTGDGSQQALLRKRVKDRAAKQQQYTYRRRDSQSATGTGTTTTSSSTSTSSSIPTGKKQLRTVKPKGGTATTRASSLLPPLRKLRSTKTGTKQQQKQPFYPRSDDPPQKQQQQYKNTTKMFVVGASSDSTAETTLSGSGGAGTMASATATAARPIITAATRTTTTTTQPTTRMVHVQQQQQQQQQTQSPMLQSPGEQRLPRMHATPTPASALRSIRNRDPIQLQMEEENDLDGKQIHLDNDSVRFVTQLQQHHYPQATATTGVTTTCTATPPRQSLLDSAYYVYGAATTPTTASPSSSFLRSAPPSLDHTQQDLYPAETLQQQQRHPPTRAVTPASSPQSAASTRIRQMIQQRRSRAATTMFHRTLSPLTPPPVTPSPTPRRIRFQLDATEELSPPSHTSSTPPASILRSTGRYTPVSVGRPSVPSHGSSWEDAAPQHHGQAVPSFAFFPDPPLLMTDVESVSMIEDHHHHHTMEEEQQQDDTTTVQSAVAFIETVAAIVVQTAVRRWLVLRWVYMRRNLENQAAVRVQAVVRGRLVRQTAWERQETTQRMLQQQQHTTTSSRSRRLYPTEEQEEQEWREFQQLQVQKQHEQRLAGLTPPSPRSVQQHGRSSTPLAPYHMAATIVQAAFRGYWVRDCIHVDQYCATLIQHAWRQWYREQLVRRLQRASMPSRRRGRTTTTAVGYQRWGA